MDKSQKKMQQLRNEYTRGSLTEDQAGESPFPLFSAWMEDAVNSGNPEPNAMTLATADQYGQPSARAVLLKSYGPEGFVFFTNYKSRKGRELADNPQAALLFYWGELQRQVRLEGRVYKLDRQASEAYFSSRPRESRLAAWSSPQSEVIAGRDSLIKQLEAAEDKFKNAEVPTPQNWGGYVLMAGVIEFWQGRKSRLHDRLRYTLAGEKWLLERLAP